MKIFNEPKYQNDLDSILGSKVPIIIFGAGIIGSCVLKGLLYFNKNVVAFCDNDAAKWKDLYEDLPVYSPQTVMDKHPDALIFIALSNAQNVELVRIQLEGMGLTNLKSKNIPYSIYHLKVLKREVNADLFMQTLEILEKPQCDLILNMVGVVITEICTLKCKDCSLLIPYIDRPRHYEEEAIIKSIKKLATSVDAINAVTILGGESLLHPSIVKICKEASAFHQVERVHILTNGTVLPTEETLKALKNYISFLIINDYGELSNRKNDLVALCEKIQLSYQIYPNTNEWYSMNDDESHNLSQIEAEIKYNECPWGKQFMEIQNGKFHTCGYSAASTELGIVNGNEDDYVNLCDDSLGILETKLQIEVLMKKATPLTACSRCTINFKNTVPRAVQITTTSR